MCVPGCSGPGLEREMSDYRVTQTRLDIQGAVHLRLILRGSVQDVPRGQVGKVVEAGSYRAWLSVLGDTDFIPYARGPQALPVKDQMINR